MRLLPLAIGGIAAAFAARKVLQQRRSAGELTGAGGGAPTGQAVTSPPVAAPEGGMAAGERATAPPEAPGPSVPAPVPGEPARGEQWEQTIDTRSDLPGERITNRTEDIVAEEEAKAAAEAAAIGGGVPRAERDDDPAMRPVYEAGGGEAEGFEQAEEELIRNATHDDGRGDPARDAFRPEAEADAGNAVYGEADQLPSTEQREDDEGRGAGTPSDA